MTSFLAEHGWLKIPKVFSEQEVLGLREAFEMVVAGQADALSPDWVYQWADARSLHPRFAQQIYHERLWALVSQTLGVSQIQLLQDVLLYRPPRSQGRVEWHQDHSYTSYLTPPDVVSVRVALTDSRVETGCLHVVDGSHLWAWEAKTKIGATTMESNGFQDVPAHYAQGVTEATVALEMAPGDVSVHRSKTFHASFENRSDEPQMILVNHVFSSECRLDRTRLPGAESLAHFPTTSLGHLDPKSFPLLGSALDTSN